MEGIFEDRLVALNGPVNYPPRSPDLTVMDIWVFAYIKGKSIVTNKSSSNISISITILIKSSFLEELSHQQFNTVDELKNGIRAAVQRVRDNPEQTMNVFKTLRVGTIFHSV